MATKDELDLAQLSDSYDILGQVGGAHASHVVLATRKEDRHPVLITVYRDPEGDEGNALNHLASDARLLAGTTHPGLVRVLDSRWLGPALAIVTERVSAPSLADRLARRDEDFPFPRIATTLRDINATLEWAREQRVVHRCLDLESVFIEEGSDRVRVMFVAQPLPANGLPDDRDDARTVASIARAMLTRSVADPERDELPLAELRPGLPSRVVAQAEALIGRADSLEPVDVRSFIAAVAMSEELRRGEDECARVTREMSEEQRITREQLAAERKAHEEDIAAQAKKFEEEKDEILKTMAREREETAKAMAKEREAAEKQLRQERERFAKEMERQRDTFDREMTKQRSALEKERVRITRARERMERDRERFEKERAAAEAAMAAGAAAAASAVAIPAPTTEFLADEDLNDEVLPYKEVADHTVPPSVTEDRPVGVDDEILPETIESVTATPAAPAPVIGEGFASRWSPAPTKVARWRSRKVIGAAAVLLLLVVAVTALALGRGGNRTGTTLAQNATPQVRVVDSMAGLTVPASPLDSAFARDSISAASPVVPSQVERPVRRPRRDTVATAAPAAISGTDPTTFAAPVRDSALLPLPFTRTDSTARPDTTRRDTAQRRDTTVQRDTTTPRRDTTIAPAPLPDSVRTPGSRR